MPELPEVQTVLNGLEKAIAGKTITGIASYYPGTYRVAADIRKTVFPLQTHSFTRRGKYMLLGLDGDFCLIIHLRMTGKLVFDPQPGDVLPHERARLQLGSGEAVHFIDIRTFGKIILCHSADIQNYLPRLGPEPLQPEFHSGGLRQALKGRKAPIKNLLLDQGLVAGLGNIYVCEALYRSGIDPRRGGSELTLKELTKLVAEIKLVLTEALACNGTSVSDYRGIDDKTGEFQNFLQVYQKKLCPREHALSVIKQAGRSTWYCPHCQK